MNDTGLLRAAAERDPQALTTLYRTHFGPLQRRALALTGCPEDAADAAQDALLATFARLPALDLETLDFDAYLHTVVRREALARRREIAEPIDQATEDDPYAQVERAEFQRRVRGAIRALPERQRLAIFRAEFQQRPRADIAAEFGLTENATGQLLFRARRSLGSNFDART